mmetsp:Transcript_66642/g.167958  ORF Transcript_66642/g.167958 Transcript_66642/m.167958 type:complete len:989 (-) Transcript_66642:170-3136(-)
MSSIDHTPLHLPLQISEREVDAQLSTRPLCPFRLHSRRQRSFTISVAAVALLVCGATTYVIRSHMRIGQSSQMARDSEATDHVVSGNLSKASDRETLPGGWAPMRYNLELRVDPCEESGTFHGRLAMDVRVESLQRGEEQGVRNMTLNARNLSIAETSVVFRSSAPGYELRPAEISWDLDQDRVKLSFAKPLPVGDGTLELSYIGQLSGDMAGLYKSTYQDAQGQTQVIALTQLEAIEARRVFPCWDEPAQKASFNLSVTIPEGFEAFSNMPVTSQHSSDGVGMHTVIFQETPVMSTYLLALAVGRFDSIQHVTEGGVVLRVLAVPGQVRRGAFALDVAARALDFYEKYFDVKFPLPKLDMLAAPDFAAGAMENWGLVIYREVDMLCDEMQAAVAQRIRIATVVTHELAHMWFGNLVTMQWWDQLWLNEGFANFMQTYATDALFPQWGIWEQYIVQDQSNALALDSLRSSHPIQVPIRRARDVDEVFDLISYSKGGSVVRMLQAYVGADNFRNGLVRYMKKHAYGSASTSDLWSCMEAVSGQPVGQVMDSWTRQEGFPLLIVEEANQSFRAQRLHLSQSRFLADGSKWTGKQIWNIPLHPGPMNDSAGRSGQGLLATREMSWDATHAGDWLKFNFGQVAPYRVLYAGEAFRMALVKSVSAGKMPAIDRMGLLLDSFALVRQGTLPPDGLVHLLIAFKGEDNTHVWQSLAGILVSMRRSMSFNSKHSESLEAFDKAISTVLVLPAMAQCGWTSAPGEDDLMKQKRAVILGLVAQFLLHDDGVVQEAYSRYNAWLAAPDSAKALPDDLKASIFKIVLANAPGHEVYNALVSHARRAETPQAVRLSILSVIGAAPSPDLRAQTLASVLGGPNRVRLQDIMYPIQGVAAADPAGARLAWSWFVDSRSALEKRLQGANVRLLGTVIQACAGSVLEASHANEVEAHFRMRPALGLERSVAQTVESVRTEARFASLLASPHTLLELQHALQEAKA